MAQTSLPPSMQNLECDICVYTDGSCRKNPGPGGIAALIFYNSDRIVALSKYIGDSSTNNKAEICAIKEALEHIKQDGHLDKKIVIFSDSEYALNSIAGQYKSEKNVWLIDETKKLVTEAKNLRLFFIRGHNGNEWNEACDVIANYASSNPDTDITSECKSIEELSHNIKMFKEATL